MKKIGIGLLSIIISLNFVSANNDNNIFQRAYEKGLISFANNLYAEDDLNRGQFSWIILKYLENVAKKEYSIGNCKAEDIEKASPLHQEALKKICEYGIMKGEKGRLYPLWKLTNAQALAVVMRIIDGWQQESTEGGKHRAINYYTRADQLGYEINQLKSIKNAPISYRNMLNLLYSTEHSSGYSFRPSEVKKEDPLKNLYEIIHQAPSEEKVPTKTSCNTDYAGRWLNKLNAYDDLCKEGDIKSFAEYRTERRWECENKEKSQTISCQANKQNISETNTTSITNNDKATCNSKYHKKTQETLSTTNQLCDYGNLRDFKTQTRGWTWNCVSNNQNTQTSCWTEKTIKNTTIEKAECGTAINICQKGQALNIQETSNGRLWTCKLENHQQKCGICKSGYNRNETEKACIATDTGNNNTGGSSGGSNGGGSSGGNNGNNNGGSSGGNNGGETTPIPAQPKTCEGELVLNHENECVQPTPEKCFETDKRIITKYKLDAYPECGPDVVIPKRINGREILEIGDYAIKGQYRNSDNINDNVKKITSVVLPQGIQKIGTLAFAENKLKKIIIPNSVKEIRSSAFYDNEIKSLLLGTDVRTIGYNAFFLNKIEILEIPESVCDIGDFAFGRNQIRLLKLPGVRNKTKCENYHSRKPGIFNENKLPLDQAFITYRGYAGNGEGLNKNYLISYGGEKKENITIPQNIKIIGPYAFARSDNPRIRKNPEPILSVILHEGILEIKEKAFHLNSLTNIEIPNSVNYIGENAFYQCKKSECREIYGAYERGGIYGYISSPERMHSIQNHDSTLNLIIKK